MKTFIALTIVLVASGSFATDADKNKMVLRYVVRSTRNGDTQMSISVKDGSVKVDREMQKLNCQRSWDKNCFAKRTYNGKISVQQARSIVDDILNGRLLETRKDANSGSLGGEQYAIGILEEGARPRYANATQEDINENKLFKRVKFKLQKIASKVAKI